MTEWMVSPLPVEIDRSAEGLRTQVWQKGRQMEWKINYDEAKAVVIATVEGKIQAERTAEMAVQGIELARERYCDKFLIDYRLAEVEDSILDTYEFMINLSRLGITRNDKIAIVYSHEMAKHLFAETVAQNRGWSNIRYFLADVEGALSWLQKL